MKRSMLFSCYFIHRKLKTCRRLPNNMPNVLLNVNLAPKHSLKKVMVCFVRFCHFCFFSLETNLTAQKIKLMQLFLEKLSNPRVLLPLGCPMRLWWSPYLCLRKNANTSTILQKISEKSIFRPKKRL